MKAGFATIAAIQAADPAVLTSILTYHVISGRVLSSDLTEGAQPTTVNGGKVMISLSGGAKVKGNKNATAAMISPANLLATNGVIHVIDQVLLP
ncbi:fasciclin domain-containing protein [Sphingobacterium sp. KU25419]|nr:fasciclin domain-containing protein [Sphingobacterium sp. KU25419]